MLIVVAAAAGDMAAGTYPILYLVALLAVIAPFVSATVRRLHDTNRSGWWVLLSFVPLGGIVLLVWTIMDGTPGPNDYGPDPKQRLSGVTANTSPAAPAAPTGY